MKTLYYPAYNELTIDDRPVPELQKEEVLIQVAACGICGSELESFAHQSTKRTPPIIMGHEFCGTVSAVGVAVKGFAPGDKVVSNALVTCGECAACKRGETNLCGRREVFSMHRNGAFAEYVNVPASSLLPMPAGLPATEACLAEPLANGVHMVELTRGVSCKNVLIIGAGPIGLMALQAFKALRGASCVVADLNEERLAVAARLGAVKTINPRVNALEEAMNIFTWNMGVDIVIDAVGNKITTAQAIKVVRPGGAVVLIGLQENNNALFSYELITAEKQVIGSYAATMNDMRMALELMSESRVDVHSWVHYYPINDGVAAFQDMLAAKDGHIKSVITF